MTSEITEPTTPPISAQCEAAEALVALIGMFGSLPGGYITIHRKYSLPVKLGLQLESPQAFEQWRTMLEIAPSAVDAQSNGKGGGWLRAEGVFHGVVVDLSGHGVTLPVLQEEPQAADEPAEAVTAA